MKYLALVLLLLGAGCAQDNTTLVPREYLNLNVARSGHTTTNVDDKLLVVGGVNGSGTVAEIEEYNGVSFTVTARLNVSRYLHTVNKTASGMLLVFGGYHLENGMLSYVSEIEEINPNTGVVSVVGNLNVARSVHRSHELPDGRIIVIGGEGLSGVLNTAEIFNPSTGLIEQVINTNTAHADFDSVQVASGDIYIVGGIGSGGGSIERFSVSSGLFESVGILNHPRCAIRIIELNSGKILVTGGYDGHSTLSFAEVFDPATGLTHNVASMNQKRDSHVLYKMNDGKILVIAGADVGISTNSIEVFDPINETFQSYRDMDLVKDSHTVNLMDDGSMVVVGGINGITHTFMSQVEVFKLTE